MAKINHHSSITPAPLSRREFIKFSGVHCSGAALLLSPLSLCLSSSASQASTVTTFPSLWMYDPEITSKTTHPQFGKGIDISEERKTAWKTLRSLGELNTVSGTSSWSDLLIIRGQLESCGMRLVKSEQYNAIFHWQFVDRALLQKIS